MQAGSMSLAGTKCEAREGGGPTKNVEPVSKQQARRETISRYMLLPLLDSRGKYNCFESFPICKLLVGKKRLLV